MKRYIMAGDEREASDFARAEGLTRDQYIYVSSSNALVGITGPTVEAVGNYKKHPNYEDIAAAIKDRYGDIKRVKVTH
jgi:hypothetical protein